MHVARIFFKYFLFMIKIMSNYIQFCILLLLFFLILLILLLLSTFLKIKFGTKGLL